MKHTIKVEIAGLIVDMTCEDSAVADRIRRRYAAFLGSGRAHATIAIKIVPGAQYIKPQPGTVWISNVSIDDRTMSYESYLERARLDLDSRHAELEMAPNGEVENFLRALYAWLCLQHDSLLLHAAGVIRGGQGLVFFGPSGAGKSTVAGIALQNGHGVVSDDIVIVRRIHGRYVLCGVPFLGELADAPRLNASAPLRGVFRLHQALSHDVRPLPRARAIAELAASAPFVVQDSRLSGVVLDVCRQLVDSVPVAMLDFRRDAGLWKAIDSGIPDGLARPPLRG